MQVIDIKENVNSILKQKKISGAEVARRMGLDRQGFYQMLKRDNLELISLKRIATALNVPVADLLKDNDENVKIDNLSAVGNSKVVIQIEIDTKIESNMLRMVFGKDFFNQIKK